MQTNRGYSIALAGLSTLIAFAVPMAGGAQDPPNTHFGSHDGPHPIVELESPRPASHKSHKSHKEDPVGPAVQLRYRITPNTSGVSAAWLEVWDRPELLKKIPVRVAKNGEITWIDSSAPTPTRLELALLDPDASALCPDNCGPGSTLLDTSPVAVAGEDVTPSFLSDPVRIRAGAETFTMDLNGRFFSPGTKVLLAEPTLQKDVWKAWEFLPNELVDSTKLRVTISWSYLASSRKLVLWPFSLDGIEAAQASGLSLNGTEQKTPKGGGAQEIVYVASSASPILAKLEPEQLSAEASDRAEAVVVLHGSGFTRTSLVLIGRDPLRGDSPPGSRVVIAPKFLSPETLEVTIPASQLRFSSLPYSRVGPLRLWVRNGGNALEVSESRDIQILSTAKLPPAPLPGVILSIVPSPLPLMTSEGPERVEVTVNGENFRPNDSIVAGSDGESTVKLPTQFISSTELRVSVPRDLWREHRISYRFVIVTAEGERAAELYEDEDAPEPDAERTSSK